MSQTLKAAVVAALAAMAGSASAVVLDFENIAPYPNNNNVLIEGYYNGGTSSIGTSGANYGIEFSDNALLICLNTLGTGCSNTSRGGLGDPNSQQGALFFLSGSQTFMNRTAGFANGFSFFYTAINSGGSFTVWDGLNGTGNQLATLSLATTPTGSCSAYGAGFCPFYAAGVSFAGTAHSVTFAGVANQIVFDDVTFGSSTPGVPEPQTYAMMLAGLGLVGAIARRRRSA